MRSWHQARMLRSVSLLGIMIALGARAVASPISPYVYVNRCTNDCVITGGASDDARMQTSSIPTSAGPFTIHEFTNDAGQPGSAADAEWSQIVQYMKQLYAPYAVTVTDQRADIPAGASFTEVIIAGQPG